ncbi:MAG TPA: hypothetical protein PLX21_01395 [Rhodocyclaceae bacterium]|nr:hypothetical protein [Rhodocyclaceae bacterium]HNI80548.1 hypothetical protein [Rhodocyclaceae bacterium]
MRPFACCPSPAPSVLTGPAVLVAVLLLTATPADAEPSGRLFHTPEERQRLDRLLDNAASGRAQPERLDGIITRGDGRTTLILDGHPRPPAADLRPLDARSAQILANDGQTHRLRVGERLPPLSVP